MAGLFVKDGDDLFFGDTMLAHIGRLLARKYTNYLLISGSLSYRNQLKCVHHILKWLINDDMLIFFSLRLVNILFVMKSPFLRYHGHIGLVTHGHIGLVTEVHFHGLLVTTGPVTSGESSSWSCVSVCPHVYRDPYLSNHWLDFLNIGHDDGLWSGHDACHFFKYVV